MPTRGHNLPRRIYDQYLQAYQDVYINLCRLGYAYPPGIIYQGVYIGSVFTSLPTKM